MLDGVLLSLPPTQIIASPSSSLLWIRYMAFQLSLTEVEGARSVAERALASISFRDEQEKLNVWSVTASSSIAGACAVPHAVPFSCACYLLLSRWLSMRWVLVCLLLIPLQSWCVRVCLFVCVRVCVCVRVRVYVVSGLHTSTWSTHSATRQRFATCLIAPCSTTTPRKFTCTWYGLIVFYLPRTLQTTRLSLVTTLFGSCIVCLH